MKPSPTGQCTGCGLNTFLDPKGSGYVVRAVIRAHWTQDPAVRIRHSTRTMPNCPGTGKPATPGTTVWPLIAFGRFSE